MSEKWKLKTPQSSTAIEADNSENNELKSVLKKETPGGKVYSTIF